MLSIKNLIKSLIVISFILSSCNKDSLTEDNSQIRMNIVFSYVQTFGVYEKGVALTEKNYIKLYIHAEAGKYNITTPLNNGYKFTASGEFTKEGDYEIILKGEGTPLKEQLDQFILTSNNDDISIKIKVFSNLSNKIIVASGINNLDTAYTYAVTGGDKILWKMKGSGGPATVINGIIYIKINAKLVAMNIETAQVIWSKDNFPNIEYITDYNNVLYVIENGSILHALNPQDGTVTWTKDLPGYGGGMVLKDNIIYFGADQLMALNTDGTTRWTTNYMRQVQFCPVICNDRIIVRDGSSLYLVNLNNGDSIWSTKVQGMGAPVYSNGAVYLNNFDGKINCYNLLDKKVLWENAPSGLFGSPFVYDNKVFTVCNGLTNVVAFDAQTGSKLWSRSGAFAQTQIIACDSVAFVGSISYLIEINQRNGNTLFYLAAELGIDHYYLSVVYNRETKKAIYPSTKGNL